MKLSPWSSRDFGDTLADVQMEGKPNVCIPLHLNLFKVRYWAKRVTGQQQEPQFEDASMWAALGNDRPHGATTEPNQDANVELADGGGRQDKLTHTQHR